MEVKIKQQRGVLLIGEKGDANLVALHNRLLENWSPINISFYQSLYLDESVLAGLIAKKRPYVLFFSAKFLQSQLSLDFNLHNFLCREVGSDFLHTVMLCQPSELAEFSIFGAEEILSTPLHLPAVDSCLRRYFLGTKTILLLEPQKYESSYLKTALCTFGFRVSQAYAIEEALAIAKAECPDLILCRSNVNFLQKECLTTSIPVIVYASQGSADEMESILQAGAADYVILSGSDLLQRIEFQFRRHYGRRQKILIAGHVDTNVQELRRILGQRNFRVFSTATLEGFLSDNTEPDLLIVDSSGNGDDCFAFLQGKNPDSLVSVILLATDKYSLLPQKSVVLRVDDVLIKPYTFSALLRSIEGAFFRRAAQQNELERLAIQKELLIGQEIQKSIMSEKSVCFDNCLAINSFWQPARILGGDFFGIFQTFVEKGKVIVCIADVCGKGLSAALVAIGAHSSLHSNAQFFSSPALLLNGLNNFLCDSSLVDDFFLTIFVACIDFKHQRMHYAIAGHNEMILYSAAQKEFVELSSRFCPCGILSDVEYENELPLHFAPGDRLFLYTDGITEALNIKGEQFSKQKLIESLQRHIHISDGRKLAEAVSHDVSLHIGEAKQSDDITILVVEALPCSPS